MTPSIAFERRHYLLDSYTMNAASCAQSPHAALLNRRPNPCIHAHSIPPPLHTLHPTSLQHPNSTHPLSSPISFPISNAALKLTFTQFGALIPTPELIPPSTGPCSISDATCSRSPPRLSPRTGSSTPRPALTSTSTSSHTAGSATRTCSCASCCTGLSSSRYSTR